MSFKVTNAMVEAIVERRAAAYLKLSARTVWGISASAIRGKLASDARADLEAAAASVRRQGAAGSIGQRTIFAGAFL